MTDKARKDLRDYQGFQGDSNSNLDYDRQRDEEVRAEQNLKENLGKKKNE